MFVIILSLVAALLCALSCGTHIHDKKPVGAVFFGFLSIVNLVFFFLNLTNYNSNEIEKHEIKNVTRYDIDSTMTISRAILPVTIIFSGLNPRAVRASTLFFNVFLFSGFIKINYL